MNKFGIKKYIAICVTFIIVLVAVAECEAQTLETILKDKYEMNVDKYKHLNYTYEMFINDGDFGNELLTFWKLGIPFEEQSNKFMKWYNKEFNAVEKVRHNDTIVYVAIGLVLLDIAINRYYYRNQYFQ